jgi:hypothetical protein
MCSLETPRASPELREVADYALPTNPRLLPAPLPLRTEEPEDPLHVRLTHDFSQAEHVEALQRRPV